MSVQFLTSQNLLKMQVVALLEGLHCSLLTGSWPLVTASGLMSLGWRGLLLFWLVFPVSWRGQGVSHSPDCHSQPLALSSTSCLHAAASSQHSPLPVQSCPDSPQALEHLKVDT